MSVQHLVHLNFRKALTKSFFEAAVMKVIFNCNDHVASLSIAKRHKSVPAPGSERRSTGVRGALTRQPPSHPQPPLRQPLDPCASPVVTPLPSSQCPTACPLPPPGHLLFTWKVASSSASSPALEFVLLPVLVGADARVRFEAIATVSFPYCSSSLRIAHGSGWLDVLY